MNFRQKIRFSFLFYIVVCSSLFAQVVDIPDPNLTHAVREALGLPPNVRFTDNHLRQLNALDADGQNIADLTGLEYAVNLRRLHIPRNRISDLSPIANLTALTYLDVGVSELSDIKPIEHLTNLTTLVLSRNQIIDISSLANLVNLTHLRLNGNGITEINPLANLTNLVHLSIMDNRIVDVTPLANLRNLNYLELQSNRITDATPLANLANLEYLNTQNNPIFDPDSPLIDIPDLNLRAVVRETLNLPDGVSITRAAMLRLTKIVGSSRDIANLTGLEFAENLEFLELCHSPIADLSPLANLTQLHTLYVWDCDVVDISPLANLTRLAYVDLSYNRIGDISALANLTNLIELLLIDNLITDVTPLANLTNLGKLWLQQNDILDYSPLDALSIGDFRYDEICDMPPLLLKPRLENRSFPSLFAAWGGPGWIRTLNRPDLSDIENLASHDLWFSNPRFGLDFRDTSQGIKVVGMLEKAKQRRGEFLAHNPNMIFLVEIRMRDAFSGHFPHDSPNWLRDAEGNRIGHPDSTLYLIDFTRPDVQELIIQQAIAVSKCGLYDGVLFDHWREGSALGIDNTLEQRARDNILQRIRSETRPDFLIMGNTNNRIIPRTAPYLNGGFLETFVPGNYNGAVLETELTAVENALLWLEENLREPQINALECWRVPTESPDSATNLRWMRAITTLSLTHSDGYVLFKATLGHKHYWYNFWGADLGRPVSEEKAQLYDNREGLYIREFTNGWAAYNHSGEQQVVNLPEETQGVSSGLAGTEHALANLDGEMYLRGQAG